MIPEHGFWWVLVMACLAWYAVVTLLVAYRGAKDIRGMIGRLSRQRSVRED